MKLSEALEQATKNKLVLYGIQNEESDLRIHVCPIVQRLYLFPTSLCADLIRKSNYPVRTARNHSLLSAMGMLVPPDDIPMCYSCTGDWFHPWWQHLLKKKDTDTSTKGAGAMRLVEYALRKRQIPLRLNELPIDFSITEVNNEDSQIKGADAKLKFSSNLVIQVKYDLRGGNKALGGTGNLFIQIAERNYYNQY